jgi:AmmeMemoRadiSam system protein B
MNLNKMGLFLIVASIGLGVLFSILLSQNGKSIKMTPSVRTPKVLLHCNFYNEKDFISSVEQAKEYHLGEKHILGGVTPHHLLAGKLIASFFRAVSKSKPDFVVIIAPNHKGVGTKNIQTGGWDWDTPFGILKGDLEMAGFLIATKKAEMDEKVLQQDHSIAGLIPYVKYYMPDAKVLPILVRGAMGIDSAAELGASIPKLFAGKKYVIIASVDFSHYLTLREADVKDDETLKTIKSGNLNKIAMFGNDNMDSPPSIITLLSAMRAADASSFRVLEHSNAGRIAKLKSDSTTSYFTIVWS